MFSMEVQHISAAFFGSSREPVTILAYKWRVRPFLKIQDKREKNPA